MSECSTPEYHVSHHYCPNCNWGGGEIGLEERMAQANYMACAYNAAVSYGTGRHHKKMWGLIRAINDYYRLEGWIKLTGLVELGIIESFEPCPVDCCIRPGGQYHVKDCPNDFNSEFMRSTREKIRAALPRDQATRYTSIGLVGNRRDGRMDMILPLIQRHKHTDPIGNRITCQEAGCPEPETFEPKNINQEGS